ncbi:MAG: alkaline phosphatase family protein [Phycisphaerae bacterium]
MRRTSCTITAVVCLVAALLVGCAADRPLRVRLAPDVARPDRAVVLFFIDGLGRRQFGDALSRGDLPNVRREIVDRGVRVETAVASIPSITYANAVTFITGRFPGRHGIVSNKWFDPTTRQYQNYCSIRTYRDVDADYRPSPTLYEILSDRVTVNLQAAQRRGVTHTIDNWATGGVNWFFHNYTGVDCLVAQDFELIARRAPAWGRWPDFVMAYFPGVDEIGHRFGPDSEAYRRAMANVDRQIGRICTVLREVGVFDRTVLCLVSDHGMAAVGPGRHFDLAAFLRERIGRRIWIGDVCRDAVARRRLARDHDYALAVSGSRWAALYAIPSDDDARSNALTEMLEGLAAVDATAPVSDSNAAALLLGWLRDALRHPAVEMAAVSARPGVIHLFRRDRHAVIVRSADRPFHYTVRQRAGREVIPPDDVPDAEGLTALPAIATARYPDLVPQVTALFDTPRAGHVVFFAADGWDFAAGDSRGGHGSVLRADMLVPMLFAGPGLPAGESLPVARNADVMPTLLGFLGATPNSEHSGPLEFDGVDLFAK